MRELQQDRRRDEGLVFDAARGRLSMGANGTDLPRGGGNRAVLEVYVDLVARCRGTRPDTLMEVRAEDISGLSAALDLDAADLRLLIEEILAVDTDQAVGLLIRLLQHRLVVGAAVAAAGVVAVGALALGGSSGSASAEPVRPAAITTTTVATATADEGAPVIDGPLVETEDGVGLIPAVQEERDGTVLISAEQLDAEDVVAPADAAPSAATPVAEPAPAVVEAAPAPVADAQVEADQIDAAPVAMVVAPDNDAPVIDGPLVETEDGVGLIPAVQEERDGTVLIPAEQLDAEPVAAAG